MKNLLQSIVIIFFASFHFGGWSDNSTKLDMIDRATELGGEEGLALLQPLVQAEEFWIRMIVANAVREIGKKEGLALLQPLAQDESFKVKRTVFFAVESIYAVESIGEKEGLAILQQLAQDEDPRIRFMVAHFYASGSIGGTEGLAMALLQQLAQDESPWPWIRRGAAQIAREIRVRERRCRTLVMRQ